MVAANLQERKMGKATKFLEKGIVLGAKAGWSVFNSTEFN